jgi:hypothetical protein
MTSRACPPPAWEKPADWEKLERGERTRALAVAQAAAAVLVRRQVREMFTEEGITFEDQTPVHREGVTVRRGTAPIATFTVERGSYAHTQVWGLKLRVSECMGGYGMRSTRYDFVKPGRRGTIGVRPEHVAKVLGWEKLRVARTTKTEAEEMFRALSRETTRTIVKRCLPALHALPCPLFGTRRDPDAGWSAGLVSYLAAHDEGAEHGQPAGVSVKLHTRAMDPETFEAFLLALEPFTRDVAPAPEIPIIDDVTDPEVEP